MNTERERQINEAKYPLKFCWGLTKMGVGEKNVGQRMAKYDKFFRNDFPRWKPESFPRGFRSMIGREDFTNEFIYISGTADLSPADMSKEEVDQLLELHKKAKWPDTETLLWVAEKWFVWNKANTKMARSESGKCSGLKRRAGKNLPDDGRS